MLNFLSRTRTRPADPDRGFTLVELLVVIIIIGVLTAVAVPMFLNQQKKAHDAAAKADLAKIGKELATWFVDTSTLPVLTQDIPAKAYLIGSQKISGSSANVILGSTAAIVGPSDWCVFVTNSKGDDAVTGFEYSSAAGLRPGSC